MAVEKKRKSRAGCRNCKLRKVKCDEKRPRCGKCEAYGVVCNYQKTVPDLQLASEQGHQWKVGSFDGASHGKMKSPVRALPSSSGAPIRSFRNSSSSTSPSAPLSTALISSDGISSLYLDTLSVEFLKHFLSHTACTIGGPTMQTICDSHILSLAFSCPLLMHAALALASSHDRYLRNSTPTKRTLLEMYHWSESIALFNRKLRSPIRPQDYDIFWATAIYLGVVTFASIEASTPEESWPLKAETDPFDLAWIRMSVGKAAIWELTNPLRPNSIFQPMAPAYARLHTPLPYSGLRNVPHVLRELCGINEESTAENNPYFTAIQALSRLAGIPRGKASLFAALAFISHINLGYKSLLEEKDAVALLLLALWYASAGHAVWWIKRRAEVEGRAICLYLGRYHWDEGTIMELLPWRSSTRFEDLLAPKGLDAWGYTDDMGPLATC